MEDLITAIIIIAGVAINIYRAFKKRQTESEPDSNETMSWEEFLTEAENSPQLREVIASDPELQAGLQQAKLQQQLQDEKLRQVQLEHDSEMLEMQKRYAQMAEQAQIANQSSMAEETSVIYTRPTDSVPPESGHNPTDWAELIRSNRTEAVIISEILAPPVALR